MTEEIVSNTFNAVNAEGRTRKIISLPQADKTVVVDSQAPQEKIYKNGRIAHIYALEPIRDVFFAPVTNGPRDRTKIVMCFAPDKDGIVERKTLSFHAENAAREAMKILREGLKRNRYLGGTPSPNEENSGLMRTLGL